MDNTAFAESVTAENSLSAGASNQGTPTGKDPVAVRWAREDGQHGSISALKALEDYERTAAAGWSKNGGPGKLFGR